MSHKKWQQVKVALNGGGQAFDRDAIASRWDAVEIPEVPGLFIGSLSAAMNRPALVANRITHVLSVMTDWRQPLNEDEKEKELSWTRKFVPVEDNPKSAKILANAFLEAYAWITLAREKGCRVLVHCHAGISRSSTMVCSYLMRHQCLTRDTSLALIRTVRPIIMPNSGFLKELNQLERDIQLQIQQLLCSHVISDPLVTQIILDMLQIDGRNLQGQMITIQEGDSFVCQSYSLPKHLSITCSEPSDEKSQAIHMAQWKPTTVTIDFKLGSWFTVRIKGLGDNWLLVHEQSEDYESFYYTIYTLPHLVGNQPSNDEDNAKSVLPNSALHYIVYN